MVLTKVVELVKREADVKAKDKKKVSALHYACGRGRLEVVKYFQTKGVDLDVEDARAYAPTHLYTCTCPPVQRSSSQP